MVNKNHKTKQKIDVLKPNNIYFWLFILIYMIIALLLLKYLKQLGGGIAFALLFPAIELLKRVGNRINKNRN
jgi:hypothetical protein